MAIRLLLPESKKDASGKKIYHLQWPATLLDSEAAVAEEMQFMDDMLAWCAIGKGAARPRTGACPTGSVC